MFSKQVASQLPMLIMEVVMVLTKSKLVDEISRRERLGIREEGGEEEKTRCVK